MNLIAQVTPVNLFEGNGLFGIGPLGLEGKDPTEAPTLFATFISSAIGIITLIGIIWFVFIFIMGAVGIITSGGDKNSLESAKKKISSGLIGLVVMLFAMLIIGFAGSIFGLTNILNFTVLFELLKVK
jgi:amino acid transporter